MTDAERENLPHVWQAGLDAAQAYLAETGFTASRALEALAWAMPLAVITERTLSEVDLATHARLTERWVVAGYVGVQLSLGKPGPDLSRLTATDGTALYSEDEARQIHDALTTPRITEAWEVSDRLIRLDWLAAEHAAVTEIAKRARIATDAQRERVLDELLTAPDGTRHPDPLTWADTREPVDGEWLDNGNGLSSARYYIWRGLEQIAQGRTGEDMSAPAAADDLSPVERGTITELGHKILLPRSLVEGGFSYGGGLSEKLNRINAGKLEPYRDAALTLKDGSDKIVADRTQLGRLTRREIRALWTIFQGFTTFGDNGRNFIAPRGRLEVPALLAYKGARVDPHNGRACRDFFHGVEDLSRRELYFSLVSRNESDGKEYVLGRRQPIFRFEPLWVRDPTDGRKRRDLSADEIAEQWSRRQPGTPWEGPLPDFYVFELTDLMRQVWHNLTMRADVLDRLDEAAKARRGPGVAFSELAFRLFVEITQKVQHGMRSEDGARVRSYINRDRLLADFYELSPEDVKNAKARGKWTQRYVSAYEQAVGDLEYADYADGGPALACRAIRDHVVNSGSSRGAKRDVFEPDPATVPSTTPRTQRRITAPDPKGTAGAEPGSAEGRAAPATLRRHGRPKKT